MPFSLSPSVDVTERDITLVAPAVATTGGAVAGVFDWGPVLEPKLITSENNLVRTFGKPTDDTAVDFFTAANFLAYGNNCRVVRVIGDEAINASSYAEHTLTLFTGDGVEDTFVIGGLTAEPSHVIIMVDGVLQIEGGSNDYTLSYAAGSLTVVFNAGSIPADPSPDTDNIKVYINSPQILNEDVFNAATGLPASFYGKYPGTKANGLRVIAADVTSWALLSTSDQALFSGAPVGDEIHIAIIDELGEFGPVGGVLERYEYYSTTPGATFANGTTAYYKKALNDQSSYIWATGQLDDVTAGTVTLAGGVDDNDASDGQIIAGYNKFANAEEIDVALIMGAGASLAVALEIIDIAETRKDAVAFLSPLFADVVNNPGNEVTDMVAYRGSLPSSSYAFLDGNWKYQYDRYNDVYRWIPMNGDIAGLCARTDLTNDPWWSPAGFNRGQIKNVIKLAHNPSKAERDDMYKNGINPVVSFEGQGTILYGDKTLLSRPSDFSRLNVRRLFIVLEKSIATAAQYILFEFNDEFTQAQFRNLVEPFLRDVQGRRGISRFAVVANSENNTAQVINNNQFVGDIFIDPARSINNIQLNFIATPAGVEFEEIEGVV